MFQLERILVPIDFSDHSLAAVSTASALARHFHSEVTLLHVDELGALHPFAGPLGYGITSSEEERAEYSSRRRKELEEFGAAELSAVQVKRVLCCGDPATVIAKCARDQQSGLILMPTRGRGAFRRFLLGSVTAKVLHDSDCPVWTGVHVAALAPTPIDIRHVMCAVDLGPQRSKAVRWAAAFAAELGASLTVMHAVLETPPNLPDRYTFQWHEEAKWGAEEGLRALLIDSHVQADSLVVCDGDIPRALSAAAQEQKAGLLVIARSCAGEESKRLGSRTYAIICNAPCPVVST